MFHSHDGPSLAGAFQRPPRWEWCVFALNPIPHRLSFAPRLTPGQRLPPVRGVRRGALIPIPQALDTLRRFRAECEVLHTHLLPFAKPIAQALQGCLKVRRSDPRKEGGRQGDQRLLS